VFGSDSNSEVARRSWRKLRTTPPDRERTMTAYLAVVSNKAFEASEREALTGIVRSAGLPVTALQWTKAACTQPFVRAEALDPVHDVAMEILRFARMRARQTGNDVWRFGLASGPTAARDEADTTLLTATELAKGAASGQILVLCESYEALDRGRQRRYLGALQSNSGHPAYASLPENHKECFCVMPIGKEDSDTRAGSDLVFEKIIQPACLRMNMLALKPQEQTGDDIMRDITRSLTATDLVVAYVGEPPWNA